VFDSTKEDLKDILRDADEGRLQLPDFQRDYVWADEDVRSLIASIAKGFPVGALLTLETGSEVSFKPRPLSGSPAKNVEPAELLLDGQQRITSLYQSTFSNKPVRTRRLQNKHVEVERHYYLDIKKCVDGKVDLYDAIVGVPADRVLRTNFGKDVELDLSSPDKEYEADMFPLEKSFDSKDWFYGWRDHWKAKSRDVVDLERDFYRQVLERIERYKMPIIRLDKKNSREAICLVFEKVNVGGKKLDAFELLTAVYASENYDLRDAWSGDGSRKSLGIRKRMLGGDFPRKILEPLENTDFLQACTLLHTRDIRLMRAAEGASGKDLPQISCNRQALLGLPLSGFKKHAAGIESGFVATAAFLNEQKIIGKRDLPYTSQIVGLAAIFATLGNNANTIPAREKITRWYWAGALGELYGGGSETRIARDLQDVVAWIREDGPLPQSIADAIFQQDRLKTLRSRLAAAYKAIHALLMKQGCRDFVHGDSTELMTFFQRKIDVHHIFPRDWCKKQGIPKSVYDSIINKTPLSKQSNIKIGGAAPSVYLTKIQRDTSVTSDELDTILKTHLIEPHLLRTDNFDAFFETRMAALSTMIEKAMGKSVVLDHGSNEPEFVVDDDRDEESEE
jgi:hypothetical protein